LLLVTVAARADSRGHRLDLIVSLVLIHLLPHGSRLL
jgi:hypothetical protein